MSKYSIDLSKIGVEKFKKLIINKGISPSRSILKENFDENFSIINGSGIQTLKELSDIIKNKNSLEDFSVKTGLSTEYLVMLKREVGAFVSKPVKLGDFPKINLDYIEKLKQIGIKNSKQYFDKAYSKNERVKLSDETNVPSEFLDELISLCDLVRIWGAGPVFARIIIEANIFSVKEFIESDIEKAYPVFKRINEEQKYYSGHFSLKDIEYCAEMAKELEIVVEN